jgi:hypothetical protein
MIIPRMFPSLPLVLSPRILLLLPIRRIRTISGGASNPFRIAE